jgi:hypothetical protein
MTESYEALLKSAQAAMDGLQKRVGREPVTPTLLILGPKFVALEMPDYAANREFGIQLMKSALELNEAKAYLWCMEAWVAIRKLDDGPIPEGFRASQQPDRKECLCVQGVSRDGDSIVLTCEIKRHGHKLSFSDVTKMDGGIGLTDNLFGTTKAN